MPIKSKRINLICPVCSKEFQRTENYISHAINVRNIKQLSCSRKCSSTKKSWQGLATEAYNLAQKGKSAREISEIMNKPIGTISSWLNKKKFRRYAEGGKSYIAVKNQIKKLPEYKKCMICEFNRAVELAHITPASKGGDLTILNTIPLCPNHHYLFDHKKLSLDEAKKLEDKVINYVEYVYASTK